MKECVCPPALTRLLKSYWVRHTNAGAFEVLKEVLKDDKNRPVKLEEMTRKQRRAAEYRLMREAESQSSKFITR